MVSPGDRVLALASALTLLHYTGVYMRVPLIPLYAAERGATPAGVGLITGGIMAVAAVAAIPFGLASDRWGRRAFLLGGMAVSAATSLLLPLATDPLALALVYGAAGLGVGAFSPSVMSLVGDSAVNTLARVPAGWLLDRTGRHGLWIVGGLLAAAAATAVLPHLPGAAAFLLWAGAIGVLFALAFVAVGAALSEATTPATRGLAMGGYSTSIYVGLGLGSVAVGPVVAAGGFTAGFTVAALAAALGVLLAAALWAPRR
jgi:DHA1 family multidrug resistance protein-like MFS transporter